jgi:hypothetical protein
MEIGIEIKYQSAEGKWLCFTHAVKRALQNENITPVVDDFGSEYDMRDTSCIDCRSQID